MREARRDRASAYRTQDRRADADPAAESGAPTTDRRSADRYGGRDRRPARVPRPRVRAAARRPARATTTGSTTTGASSSRGSRRRGGCSPTTARSTCTSTTARRTTRRCCSTPCSGATASSTSSSGRTTTARRPASAGPPSTTRSSSTSRIPARYWFDSEAVDREPYMAPGLVTPEKAARGKLPTDVWWHTIVPTTRPREDRLPDAEARGHPAPDRPGVQPARRSRARLLRRQRHHGRGRVGARARRGARRRRTPRRSR